MRNIIKKTKKVLFVIHLDTMFKVLEPNIKKLQEFPNFTPLVFFASKYENYDRDIEICEFERYEVIHSYGEPLQKFTPPGNQKISNVRVSIRKIIKIFPFPMLRRIRTLLLTIIGLHKKLIEIIFLIRSHEIDILILAGDIVHYDTSVFIKAAHSCNICTVIIPGWVSGPHEHWDVFKCNPEHQWSKFSNRVYSFFFPKWIYEEQGIRLVRLPAELALPRELLRLAPPKPWVVHSGYWDLMLVESEYARDYCIRDGFNPEKIIVTGSAAQDKMAEILDKFLDNKVELSTELKINADLPIILVGLNEIDFNMHGDMLDLLFRNNLEYTEFLIKTLVSIPRHSILISLHPSMVYEKHKYIEKWGAKIVHKKTFESMPLCDIYIANISSTINWAIACGKPVIIYDVMCSRSTDWDMAKGVFRIESKAEFNQILTKLTKDQKFFMDACTNQAESAHYFGVLDGKAGERMMNVLNNLTS